MSCSQYGNNEFRIGYNTQITQKHPFWQGNLAEQAPIRRFAQPQGC